MTTLTGGVDQKKGAEEVRSPFSRLTPTDPRRLYLIFERHLFSHSYSPGATCSDGQKLATRSSLGFMTKHLLTNGSATERLMAEAPNSLGHGFERERFGNEKGP